MQLLYLLFIASLANGAFAAQDELSLKVQAPLVDKVTVANAKKQLAKNPSEKNELFFIEGVAYFDQYKYSEAYNALSKVAELPYLDAYLRYYKGLSNLNAFDDESSLKKGLNDLYYVVNNSGVLADSAKDNIPLFEIKLAKAMASNKHCKSSLQNYARARAQGFSDLDEEFGIVRTYIRSCDKKVGVSLLMDLYVRFGEKASKLFSGLDNKVKEELKAATTGMQRTQTTTTKSVVQNPEATLFNSIKSTVSEKNYSKFTELSKEYLRLYAGQSKQTSKFYTNFNSFVEEALLQKNHSVSYFEDLFNFYDRDQMEKLLFKVWQKEDWSGAKDIVGIMKKRFPGYDKIYYLEGSLMEDTKKYSRAYDAYNYVVDHFPTDRYYAPSLFKLGWIRMLQQDNSGCASIFESYINEGGDNYDWALTSAYYYRAKCLQKQGRTDDAKKVKDELLAKYPFNFYSLLTMDEFGMKLPEEIDSRIQPQSYVAEPISPKDLNTLSTGAMLIRCGLNEDAKKELSGVNLEKIPAEYVENVSKLYVLAGYHELAMQASTALLTRLKVFVSKEHIEYHFPKHYFDAVTKYAEKMELDPFLIMAVMKRESAFKKDAVSRSGAIGLMQLLPSTADRFKSSKKENVQDADTNIKLAAIYLKELIQRYNGNLAYAAAAYNGGEEALDRWIKWYGDKLSGTEFIENIPYSETRAYVKSVLGNYFMYNAYYLKKHVTFDDVVKGGIKNGGV